MCPFTRAADNFVFIDWGAVYPQFCDGHLGEFPEDKVKIKCIMEIPRGSTLPEGTPSRLSVLSSHSGESSSSLSALNMGIRRGHSPK